MKNDRTPRTLSDSSFAVGYPTVPRERYHALKDLAYAFITVAACVAIGAMLAWSI